MCGRYSLATDADILRELYSVDRLLPLAPRFNICPSQRVLVVLADAAAGGRVAAELVWGLVPHWAREPKAVINARSETVEEKPTFRDSFRSRRCLFLADGFYEWQKTAGGSVPHYFSLADGQPFAIAGIWDHWTRDGADLRSCCLLTTVANETVRPVHDRMPVMLSVEQSARWLSGVAAPELRPLLAPFPASKMRAWRVGKGVNNPRIDDARCREPLAAGAE